MDTQTYYNLFPETVDYSKIGQCSGPWGIPEKKWCFYPYGENKAVLHFKETHTPITNCDTGIIEINVWGIRDDTKKIFTKKYVNFTCDLGNGIHQGLVWIPDEVAYDSLEAGPAPQKTIGDIVMWDSNFPSEGFVDIPVEIRIGIMNTGDKDGNIFLKIFVNSNLVIFDTFYFKAKEEKTIVKTITFQEAGDYNMEVKVWGEDESEP